MPLAIHQVLQNRYRIIKLLGKGGFGSVYRAWDINLRRPCAIKENLDLSPDTQRQFACEAQVLANLRHPNLVQVWDFFSIPGQGQYMVMDFIDGEDLDCLLERRGIVDPELAVGWIVKVCCALEYLHGQNPPIFHRDIKPANIRLTQNGEPVLVDFGLVKVFAAGKKTAIAARGITPGFSPPEQYGHGETDARSDIYALAATLYALLFGDAPAESIQRSISNPQVKQVALPNRAAAEQLSIVLAKALEIKPVERYQTAAQFRQELVKIHMKPPPVRPVQMQQGGTSPPIYVGSPVHTPPAPRYRPPLPSPTWTTTPPPPVSQTSASSESSCLWLAFEIPLIATGFLVLLFVIFSGTFVSLVCGLMIALSVLAPVTF